MRTNLVCLIIQAICSVEHPAAGIIRSPSFSRDSSSITTTNSPRDMAAIALSTESKAKVVRTGGVRSFGALRGGEERSGPSGTGRVWVNEAYWVKAGSVDCWRTATGAMITESSAPEGREILNIVVARDLA